MGRLDSTCTAPHLDPLVAARRQRVAEVRVLPQPDDAMRGGVLQVRADHERGDEEHREARLGRCLVRAVRGVAVQVAFESKGLKPGFHFIGQELKLWVK
jgi:hypothetical protein